MNKINLDIKNNLTSEEKELFDIILQVVKTQAANVIPRVVGGWVRDRLLGVKSNDVDVMVDNMDGAKFANLVAKYLNTNPAHVIQSNPEKSKNITTAKAYLPLSNGTTIEVDFAQSRKEIYTEDSRIPTIETATVEEDALRRDLTINAVFYNLKTQEVEDFSGKGIEDLKNNIMRTPVEPLKTFTDDPLRILRTIRFAAKYGGTIDDKTYQAMLNPKVRDAMRQKIAKERMGAEIKKMLGNKNAPTSIKLLKDTGLFADIMQDALKGTKFENKMSELEMDQNNPHHMLNLWEHTFQVVSHVVDHYQDADEEKRISMTLAALVHDLGKLYHDIQVKKPAKDKYPEHRNPEYTGYAGHEDASKEISILILRYLKLDPYVQQVSKLAEYHMKPHQLHEEDGVEEKALRRFIRKMGEDSLDWLDVFNLAMSDAKSKNTSIDNSVVDRYKKLHDSLQKALASMSQSANSSQVKPILNGNEIMQLLGIKPGPYMKEISDFVKDLMDANPNITKEEASDQIRSKFGNLKETAVPSTPKKEKNNKIAKINLVSLVCPKHLLYKTQDSIMDSIKNNNEYQATVIAKDLLGKYSEDPDVLQLTAMAMFNSVAKNKKCANVQTLNMLVKKCNKFSVPALNCFLFGLLLLVKSNVDQKTLEKIGKTASTMAPNALQNVLDKLPEKIKQQDIVKNAYKDLENEQNKSI